MTKSSRKTKPATKRIGGRRHVLLSLLLIAPGSWAQKADKKLISVIAGTVFRDPGFPVAGAEVELIEVRADGKKPKVQRAVSDARGEFAFRLPPAEAKYKVKASARGLQSEEKEASASPGVRTDVFFALKPADK